MKKDLTDLALKLRIEQQLSLRQIKKITGLALSTLSLHLRDHPLSDDRSKELGLSRSKKAGISNKKRNDERRSQHKINGVDLLKSNKDFNDLCLLYWGEGSKYNGVSSFSIANTDPNMILYITNIIKKLGYFEKLVPTSYCYINNDINEVKKFWSDIIGKEIRTYIVKTPKSSKNLKQNKHPYGTMRLQIDNKEFLYMVLGGIEYLSSK